MAFKDKEKMRTYQKAYMKQYFKKNRVYLNDYQKKLARKKRAEERDGIIQEIKEITLELGFDESSPSRLSMMVLMFVMITGIKRPYYVAKNLGASFEEVKNIFKNWKKSGHWDGRYFLMDETETELEKVLQYTMIAMVGSGHIACVRI